MLNLIRLCMTVVSLLTVCFVQSEAASFLENGMPQHRRRRAVRCLAQQRRSGHRSTIHIPIDHR